MNRSSYLNLSSEEVSFYERLFTMGDINKTGLISASMITKLMSLSKLSNDILAKIWILSANGKRELNKDDFFISCRCVSIAQQGYNITADTLMQYRDVPLPFFEGVSPPKQTYIPAVIDDSWAISSIESHKYMEFFSQADSNRDGYVSGAEAKLFFDQSNLTATQLATIWQLSDIDKDNRLSSREFAIAMHLVMKVRQTHVLPVVLPIALASYTESSSSMMMPHSSTITQSHIQNPVAISGKSSFLEISRPASVDFFSPANTLHLPVETKIETKIDKHNFNSSFDNYQYQTAPQKPVNDSDPKTVSQWQEKILQGQRELENIRFDTEGFHDKTVANKQQTAMYESQMVQLNKEIEEWKVKRTEAEKAMNATILEYQAAQAKDAQIRQQLTQEQNNAQSIQAQLNNIHEQTNQILHQVEALSHEVDISRSLIEQDSSLAAADHELSIAQGRLQQLLDLKRSQEVIVETRKEQANRMMQEKNAILERINGVNNDLMGLKQKNQSLKESNNQLENELNVLSQKYPSTNKNVAPLSNSGKAAPLSNSKSLNNFQQNQSSLPQFISPSINSSVNKPITMQIFAPKSEEKPKPIANIDLFSVPEDQDFDSNPFAVAATDDGSNPFLSNSASVVESDNIFVKQSSAVNLTPAPSSVKPQQVATNVSVKSQPTAASNVSFDNFDSWDSPSSFAPATQTISSIPTTSINDFNSWDDSNPFETLSKPAVPQKDAKSIVASTAVVKEDFGFANNDNWADF